MTSASREDPPLAPEDPADRLRGVGPARLRQLEEAGLATVGDLLHHLPRTYQDRRTVTSLGELEGEAGRRPGGSREVTVRGRLGGLRVIRTRRRGLTLVRGRLRDGSGELAVIWFNRPYLARQVPDGAEVLLHGELRQGRKGGRELLNPSLDRLDRTGEGEPPAARVVPVYPAAGSLGSAFLERLVRQALERCDPRRRLREVLPDELRSRHRLPHLGEALHRLHHPPQEADVDAFLKRDSPAHRRLIYGELLELQLELALLRRRRRQEPRGPRLEVDDRIRHACREILPFRLTGAQERVLEEIVGDLTSPRPMLRLLQGDVGSGKTVVAALALAVAMENGLQGVFMAPTELLAEQHFASLERLFGSGAAGRRYRMGLLTGSAGDAGEVRRGLARGEIRLAVGTHALIQAGVEVPRLGLAVIDEQHRFGVVQRRRLQERGTEGGPPHVLVMTATPIPRSLALTAYGDLDLSVIDELPPGRRPVATEVVPEGQRSRVYRRLARELQQGGRAYVVFPLIEDSEQVAEEALEARGRELLEGLPVAGTMVHGRLSRQERDRAMAAFAAGEVRLLVATTVIEVGVDVPEATLMVIESAQRFGLAQLHQLRGRVGRSSRPSRCIALHGRLSDDARRRLEVFEATTDGFEIAEADLEIRGPGELLGTRQAGLPVLRVADLLRDRTWLRTARRDAREILERLDEPAFRPLRRSIELRLARRQGEALGD